MVESSPVAVLALAVATDAHGLGEVRAGQVVEGSIHTRAVVVHALVTLHVKESIVVDDSRVAQQDIAAGPANGALVVQRAAIEGLGRCARDGHGAAGVERHCSAATDAAA